MLTSILKKELTYDKIIMSLEREYSIFLINIISSSTVFVCRLGSIVSIVTNPLTP